jgi:hypothetical protein
VFSPLVEYLSWDWEDTFNRFQRGVLSLKGLRNFNVSRRLGSNSL